MTDTEGKPLPDISVLAYKAGTRIIVTYSATNADGKYGFGVSAETDSLDVGVNSLFFEKQRHRIDSRQVFADNAFSGIFTVKRFTIRPKVGFLFEQRNVASQLRLAEPIVWCRLGVQTALHLAQC